MEVFGSRALPSDFLEEGFNHISIEIAAITLFVYDDVPHLFNLTFAIKKTPLKSGV
jgi:hypothetical protein